MDTRALLLKRRVGEITIRTVDLPDQPESDGARASHDDSRWASKSGFLATTRLGLGASKEFPHAQRQGCSRCHGHYGSECDGFLGAARENQARERTVFVTTAVSIPLISASHEQQ